MSESNTINSLANGIFVNRTSSELFSFIKETIQGCKVTTPDDFNQTLSFLSAIVEQCESKSVIEFNEVFDAKDVANNELDVSNLQLSVLKDKHATLANELSAHADNLELVEEKLGKALCDNGKYQKLLEDTQTQNKDLILEVDTLKSTVNEQNKALSESDCESAITKEFISELKHLGGPAKVVSKINAQKKEIIILKANVKKLGQQNRSSVPQGVKLRENIKTPVNNKLLAKKYIEVVEQCRVLSDQNKTLSDDYETAKIRLDDVELLLGQKEGMIGIYGYQGEFLYTFPNRVSFGQEGAMHRTLLYINNKNAGGLLHLQGDGVALLGDDPENKIASNASTVVSAVAKIWLEKLSSNKGVLVQSDLDITLYMRENVDKWSSSVSPEVYKLLLGKLKINI